jgi:hypothetical protein
MPLKPGYSKKTVDLNIVEMVNNGKSNEQAVKVALDWGRVSFFKVHPQGHMPAHLALPNGRRDRAAFNKFYGHYEPPIPPMKNPIKDRQSKINAATKLYADFTGEESEIVGTYPFPVSPQVGVAIGECCGIAYETVRDGQIEKYLHEFAKNDRPLLVSSFDGKQLYILGGEYDFTENGIVDASDKRYSPRYNR